MKDIYGIDYEWCAADADGHLAIFTTAGEAPVPLSVLQENAKSDELVKWLKDQPFCGGYIISSHDKFARGQSGCLEFVGIGLEPTVDDEVTRNVLSDFLKFAQRGYYSYDWPDAHRPATCKTKCYELIATPENPLYISHVPQYLISSIPQLPNISFDEARLLRMEQLLECVSSLG